MYHCVQFVAILQCHIDIQFLSTILFCIPIENKKKKCFPIKVYQNGIHSFSLSFHSISSFTDRMKNGHVVASA